MAEQEFINIGATPNDGNGDPLRVAFGKINNNFSNLFSTFVNQTVSYSIGNTPGQVIFETAANTFTLGQFYIKSTDNNTSLSQSIQLFAQINNDHDDVKFSGFGGTFYGNSITSYDMIYDIATSNVQVVVNPLTTDNLVHFINYSIMYAGANVPGLNMITDQVSTDIISTEFDASITTEQQ